MIPADEEQQKAIRRLRTVEEESFKLVVKWLNQSLIDQTKTNEQLFDTNRLFNGQGRSACLREILQALAQ